MSGHVHPVTVLDCPTADEVAEEWGAGRPVAVGDGPRLPLMECDNMVRLTELARGLGRDPAKVRKMASKLGCLVEYRYLMDSDGRRQRTTTTNPAGADALTRWYTEAKSGQ